MYTSEEKDKIIKMFESLDVKPKLDDQEDLNKWMEDYLAAKGQARVTMQDEQTPEDSKQQTQRSNILQKPKINIFSGSDEPKAITFATWR